MTDSKAMRVEVTRSSNSDELHDLQLRVDKIEAAARIAELEGALSLILREVRKSKSSPDRVYSLCKAALEDGA